MKQYVFVYLVFIFSIFQLHAQSYDLRQDSVFLNGQKNTFLSWLEEANLNNILSIKDWHVTNDRMQLRLIFNYTPKDSAIWAWKQLLRDYEALNGIKLQEAIFLKMAKVMQLEYNQIAITIRNRHLSKDLPAIDDEILFDNLQKKIIVNQADYRSTVKDSVYIPQYKLNKQLSRQSTLVKAINKTKELEAYISDKLEEKFKQYFSDKTKMEANVTCRSPFTFQATNLKSLIIAAGNFSFINPTEMVTYTIKIVKTKDELNVFCEVDGRYGSGFFRPRTPNGYGDMAPKYQKDLDRYAKVFTQEILSKWVVDIFNER